MSIYDLLDQLESTIENSKRPLMQSNKVIINPDELYQIIDQIRSTVPDEIKDAQWVKREAEQIKKQAQDDYERIIEDGRQTVEKMVQESEIHRLATERAREMLDNAYDKTAEITLGAFQYADSIMEKIENQLQIYFEYVEDGKEEIRQSMEQITGRKED